MINVSEVINCISNQERQIRVWIIYMSPVNFEIPCNASEDVWKLPNIL